MAYASRKDKQRNEREWRRRNPQVRNPDKAWESHLKRDYKLTAAQYFSLLRLQGGGCAVCGDLPKAGARLYVDHDHSCCMGDKSCGKCIRGLLCFKCNCLLGLASDSPSVIRSALNYLNCWRRLI